MKKTVLCILLCILCLHTDTLFPLFFGICNSLFFF